MMAAPVTPRWEIVEAGSTLVDEGQLLVVDRTANTDGRTVCVTLGRLVHDHATGNFMRVLDREDASNVRLIAMAPRMRAALAGLIEWSAGSGAGDLPPWDEARAVLEALDDTSGAGDGP